jgi:hypothetical protein
MDTKERSENQYWTCYSKQVKIMDFFIWSMNKGTQHTLLDFDFTAYTVGNT